MESSLDELVEKQIVEATAMLRQDRLEEAERAIEQAYIRDPANLRIRNLMGLLFFRTGRHNEARATYNDLLQQRPEDPALLANVAVTELRMGLLRESAEHLEHLVKLEPHNQRAWGFLGVALMRSNQLGQARDCFVRAGRNDLIAQLDDERDKAKPAVRAVMAPPEAAAVVAPVAQQVGPAGEVAPLMTDDLVEIEVDDAEMKRRNAGTRRSDDLLRLRSTLHFSRARMLNDFVRDRLLEPGPLGTSFRLAPDGLLVQRVSGRLYGRSTGVILSTGQLRFEPVKRRERGEETEPFGDPTDAMCAIGGHGMIVSSPQSGVFHLLFLDDDVLYVREPQLYAFDETLSFENGRIPGGESDTMVVQLRGQGAVVLRAAKQVHTAQLSADQTLYISDASLLGWAGRVVPRRLKDVHDRFTSYVECTGEGVVLFASVDDEQSSGHILGTLR